MPKFRVVSVETYEFDADDPEDAIVQWIDDCNREPDFTETNVYAADGKRCAVRWTTAKE